MKRNFPLAVSGNRYLCIQEAGAQRIAAAAVAAVICILVLAVVLAVIQRVIQFRLLLPAAFF